MSESLFTRELKQAVKQFGHSWLPIKVKTINAKTLFDANFMSYSLDNSLVRLRSISDKTSFVFRTNKKGNGIEYTPKTEGIQSSAFSSLSFQSITISKFLKLAIRANINIEGDYLFSDKEREIILNRACELYGESIKIYLTPEEILVSDEIEKIYSTPHAKSNAGSLSSSCMNDEVMKSVKGRNDQNHGASFIYNYDRIAGLKIAYIKNDKGDLLARGLLWENVQTEEGVITFLDRVYGSEKSLMSFQTWAENQGFWYRSFVTGLITYKQTDGYLKNLKDMKKDMKLTSKELIGMPYLDTFRYIKDSMISYRQATLPDSVRIGSGRFPQTCDKCGGRTSNPHNIDNHIYCDRCAVFSRLLNRALLNEDIIWIEVDGRKDAVDKDYKTNPDLVYFKEYKSYYHKKTLIKVKGKRKLYPKTRTMDIPKNGKSVFYLKEDLVKTDDGKYVHKGEEIHAYIVSTSRVYCLSQNYIDKFLVETGKKKDKINIYQSK